MKIEIVGAGCEKCKLMYEAVKTIINKHKLTYEIEYITGLDGARRMKELGINSTPALIINNHFITSEFKVNHSLMETAIFSTVET